MRRRPRYVRHHDTQRTRGQPETFGFPRRHMFLLAILTGLAGFVASALLLSGGMSIMWSRHLSALGIAYVTFLGLLWLWLNSRTEDPRDIPDFSHSLFPPSQPLDYAHDIVVHHGDFGGGGASASFDSASLDDARKTAPSKAVGTARLAARQAEKLAIPLAVVAFFATLLLSSLFLIWATPTLFAELAVDGVLSASLYHRLRGLQARHWIATAIRRTVWPFAVTALIVAGLGSGMAQYAPDAHSIGDVLAYANGQR